jgi:hypothetical protein
MSDTPIFIGGLMKSGTSLLRKLVSRHPNIFGGLETHWFMPEICDDWQNSTSTRQIWLRKLFDVSADDYAHIKAMSDSGIDFFNRFMWFCTRRAGKQRWVEKTPDNILHLALIWECWPDAKVIHVVRDYRDVYASWKLNKNKSLSEFLMHVHLVMNMVGDLVGKRTDSYSEVKYEDLVMVTAKVLKEVLAYIGEAWVDGLDQYEGDDADYRKVLEVTGKESPTTLSLRKPIFASSIGQWRDILTPDETEILKDELGKYMPIWGWK